MLTIWSGLAIGAIYALVAVGFNIVFVASGTFNFAQPQFLMLGTFLSYTVVVTWRLPVVVALIAGAAVGFVIGAVEEYLAVRPLAGSGAHGELVTTVGWSVILQGAVLLIWGSDPRLVPGLGSNHIVNVLGGRITITDLVLIVLAVLVAGATHLWFRSTRAGIASLATAEDRQAAMVRGINTRRLSTGAFAVAGALMASLGAVAAPKTYAVFTLGSVLVLKAFVAMAVGGFGSCIGALIGGFGVGIVEAEASRFWGTSYVNLTIFAVLIVVLLVRPQGMFGQRRERTV
jgi:branched-chain amino acid transport system permease protein